MGEGIMEKERIIDFSETLKKNDEARANLAKALIEDEASRLANAENAKLYLKKIEDEQSQMSFKEWAFWWFLLGILFTVTIDAFAYNWIDIVKFFN